MHLKYVMPYFLRKNKHIKKIFQNAICCDFASHFKGQNILLFFKPYVGLCQFCDKDNKYLFINLKMNINNIYNNNNNDNNNNNKIIIISNK